MKYKLALALTISVASAHADTSINFMGDVGYEVVRDNGTTLNTFRAPTLDIFATQREGKFAFTGEIVVEAFGSNDFSVDADRLEVEYRPTSWLRLRMGRLRTAIGYYGDAYQNGKYFLLPTDAPLVYEGTGYDGIMPSHTVGVHADAVRELGSYGKASVDAEILNGRARTIDEVPAFQDSNNSKAINVRLRYLGTADLEGLIVGGNVYLDEVPRGDASPAMHELILAGHAVYMAHGLHFVSEAVWFRHHVVDSGESYTTLGVSSELGFAVTEDLIPYARYQHIHSSAPDPYFVASEIPPDRVNLLSAGVKYIASSSVAFKVQGDVEAAGNAGEFEFQAAFAF